MKRLMFDLLNLVFPVYCPVCRTTLHSPGEVVCLKCELGMPRTGYIHDPDNPVSQIFWGRSAIDCATSLFRFEKGSAYQSLLHHLKYKGAGHIGIYLGKLLGNELKDTEYASADMIVPVPLHPKKKRKRGYNQSELIGRGVSEILDIPMKNDLLLRPVRTSTQTRKNRYERAENMEGVFSISSSFQPEDQEKILLIDDVVTTGSTLEACANELLKVPGITVMIATVACA